MSVVCTAKNALLDAYEEGATSYSRAITELRHKMGVLSQPEYQALYDCTEELRMKAREAQEALLRHIGEHGC
jgi:hypothetical protein